jgi:hypothetical protein
VIPEYRESIGTTGSELSIAIRIGLNIYRPFLMVFILISLSLVILFQLKIKKSGGGYKPALALIAGNLFIASVLLTVTLAGTVL